MGPGLPQSPLIQVVPRLLPGRCGVSDQAVLLAGELKDKLGVDSAFVVLNSSEHCNLPFETVYCPAEKLLVSCRELTQGRSAALLVHVSGYGYSADGAAALLADALETIAGTGHFRIATFFHETYASGPPWKSAFWYTHRQQRALRRIIAQSGLMVTTFGRQAEWLERESRKLGGVPVERMPVFSSAGETDVPIPFGQRTPAMIVFGLAGTRELAYRKLAATGDLMGILEIQEILDVGPECRSPSEVNGIPVKRMGPQNVEQLSSLFSRTRFGFVPHLWFYLGKSSVFAAYCANGIIPVLTGEFPQKTDGLEEGVHVVNPRTADAVRRSGWEDCSRAAWEWYMGHSLRVHAERYAKWMEDGL